MAICFARVKMVSRSNGGNACRTGAYNARSRIYDEKNGQTFDFTAKGGNVHHEMLLPEHVDPVFKKTSELMNAVEHIERKSNSQLLKEYVLALPDDEIITLEMKKELVHEFVKHYKFVEEGLAVQIDIHAPDENDNNWHAHILVPTRRFTEDGKRLGEKARDLEPEVRGGRKNTYVKANAEDKPGVVWTWLQNKYYQRHGLDLRVDLPGELTQEHVGPVRMRSVMNEAAMRNEEKAQANIENIKSGEDLIRKVTHHMSVFDRTDLIYAAKTVPGKELREKLVDEAISSDLAVSLFTEKGVKTGYYTTEKVRAEEKKVMRMSGYVHNCDNVILKGGKKAEQAIAGMIAKEKAENERFTEEQATALSHLLLSKDGIRLLKGRAGSGKSYVLGKVNEIAGEMGVHVIGLAPTHRAKLGLAELGYKNTDTIKGMLFKLANRRFDLPRNSLLVIDEGGLVGNEDYQELMRVAATRGCNIIDAGDERQQPSVSRGGMFAEFADRYGSCSILNIQRQKSEWGRAVATALSEGDVEKGVSILQSQKCINTQRNSDESMQALLADWHSSSYGVGSRMILALRNVDVAALNHGAREYLKKDGTLSGEEFEVGGNHYMKGDRILIRETNKELNLINGDLGEIIKAGKDCFVVAISDNKGNSDNDNKRIIKFNPAEFSGFRHGYATTVFNSQGASILDVFMFHFGFSTIQSSYVALSRHVRNLKLYINREATSGMGELVKQLSKNLDKGSSLGYMTEQEYKTHQQNTELMANIGRFDSMLLGAYDVISRGFTNLTDKYLPKLEYYNYHPPKKQQESVNQVIDRVYVEHQENEYVEKIAASGGGSGRLGNVSGGGLSANAGNNATAVQNSQSTVNQTVPADQSTGVDNGKVSSGTGSNNIATKAENAASGKESQAAIAKKEPVYEQVKVSSGKAASSKKSAKERFYAKADYVDQQDIKHQLKEKWDRESEQLKSEVKFKAEQIALDLLGVPNKKMSNRSTLRFGDNGKIAVRISGSKSGSWYDFAADRGGDMFDLVKNERGGSFKDAAEYLRSYVGHSSTNFSDLVEEHRNRDLTKQHLTAAKEEEKQQLARQQMVSKLYERARAIGVGDVALRYLSEVRGIDCRLAEDIRTAKVYHKENPEHKEQYIPALVAFARNSEGEVTGCQQILLDENSGAKADVAVPKKSFGRIAGSFVDVGVISQGLNDNENAEQKQAITIIAEGLETALSVKQALASDSMSGRRDINILCSLGIFNIRNYQPKQGEKIIIAADNDGKESITDKSIEKAKKELESKGAYVETVRPEQEGDYNDILLAGRGEQKIRQSFSAALAKHSAHVSEHSVAQKQEQVEAAQLQEKTDTPKQLRENQINKVEPAAADNIAKKANPDNRQLVVSTVKSIRQLVKQKNMPQSK
jgi:Ti-type conjugative transfer relaxase TraA